MADTKLTEGALKALFGSIPFALSGATLRVTYPSLAEYGARAQADMTALAKLRPVRASSVSMAEVTDSEFISESALTGPHVLAVLFD